jgi:hypothetical protein
MIYSDLNIKKWETAISDIDWISIDKIETEGYFLKIYLSDSKKNTYKVQIKYQIYNVAHEEHLFELWKSKNKIQPQIGNSFEFLDSKWIDEYSFIKEAKVEYKHLLIASDDIAIQFITDEYPEIIKIIAT